MNNNLLSYEDTLKHQIDTREYTYSLLLLASKRGLISKEVLSTFYYQISALLKKTILSYLHEESSSVKSEQAAEFTLSIFYVIDTYIKHIETIKQQLSTIRTTPAQTLYQLGYQRLQKEQQRTKQRFHMLYEHRIETSNEVYNEIYEPVMFRLIDQYSIAYAAHIDNILLAIDYPVLYYTMKKQGLEDVDEFLTIFECENAFCAYFDKQEIKQLQQDYEQTNHINIAETFVNLFEIILVNALFAQMLSPTKLSILFTESQYQILLTLLQQHEHNCDVISHIAFQQLTTMLHINEHTYVYQHVKKYVEAFNTRLKEALLHGHLKNMLIVHCEKNKIHIELAQASEMLEENFEQFLYTLTTKKSVQEKIEYIIRSNLAYQDLVDVLEGNVLFNEEYYLLYECLSTLELAYISKQVLSRVSRFASLEDEDIDTITFAQEWKVFLIAYLKILPKDIYEEVHVYLEQL